MIKAVLFDNDGILVDTEPIWVQANLEIFAELGFSVTKDWYLDYNLTQGKGLAQFLPQHGFSPEEIAHHMKRRTERYWDLLPEISPMPGVVKVLEILKSKDMKIGIVTAAERKDFAKVHSTSGLLHHFDFIIVNEDTPRTKPAPDPYLLGLEKAGVTADEAIVVEDSPRGVTAAHAAGIKKIVAVPTEITKNGDFSLAWKIESDIEKLLTLI